MTAHAPIAARATVSPALKALSALLCYPSEDLVAAAPDIPAALAAGGLLSPSAVMALGPLVEDLMAEDLYALQEGYVFLFDRTRTLSLNLFEHVHGESRDRGQAMVDLLETYRAGGFELVSSELPDHLPILLEYLSTRPIAEARDTLADAAHILAALAGRLRKRDRAYASVFDALVEIAETAPDPFAVAALAMEAEDDPSDLEALDKVWEESAVVFGPDPNAGCPVSRDLLARMDAAPVPAPASAPAAHS